MMTVDIDKLRALLELLAEQNVAEFEHESEGVRVHIVRSHAAPAGAFAYRRRNALRRRRGPAGGAARRRRRSAAAAPSPSRPTSST